PLQQSSAHLRRAVRVFRVLFGSVAESDIHHVVSQLPQAVIDRPSHRAHVPKANVRPVSVQRGSNQRSHLHRVPALLCGDLISVESPRIPSSPELDDALIRPTACVVKAADDRRPPETPGHRPRPRGHHHIGGEVLHVRRSREYSPNTYPEEVTVLTVDVRPFLQQDLVGPPHSPAVDLFRPPAGIAKLFLKLPRVPRRV